MYKDFPCSQLLWWASNNVCSIGRTRAILVACFLLSAASGTPFDFRYASVQGPKFITAADTYSQWRLVGLFYGRTGTRIVI
jgi:hypothetical protein